MIGGPMKKKSHGPAWLGALDGFKKARVLVVGDIMHDVFIWGKVRRISPEAPVPVVEASRETTLLGGSANVVNNIVALGAKAALAGVIGTDHAGDAVEKALDLIRVDRSCVRRGTRRPTAVKTRIIAHNQQVVRVDREDKRPLKPETTEAMWLGIERVMRRMDAVIVSDYAKGVVSAELMDRLRALCIKKGKVLAIDPKPEHKDWYHGADVITPNNKEASEMAGFEIETDADLDRAGQLLLAELECRALLITRGEKGMSLFRPAKRPVHVPARAREVYDVTGAGDTVVATLAVALAAGLSITDAVEAANLAASIVVAKLGTSVATVEEIRGLANNRRHK